MNNTAYKAWFKQLFDEQFNGLCNYAFSFVKDEAQAEDIVQSVFVTVWEKRKQLYGGDKITRFLIKSVKNKCIDHFRRNKPVEMNPLLTADTPDETPEPDQSDRLQLLYMAIDRLPEKTQQTFLLSRREGLTYKEIAREMEVSVKTVENQMGRALRLIRDFFDQHRYMIE